MFVMYCLVFLSLDFISLSLRTNATFFFPVFVEDFLRDTLQGVEGSRTSSSTYWTTSHFAQVVQVVTRQT
jgi:hypothetical protein